MDNEIRRTLRTLELESQAKTQDLAIAYQKIVDLEQQLSDLQSPDNTYVAPEAQIDFIKKIADSNSKFAKEAQDIIDALDANA